MTDTTLNSFLASGTNAERLAFTPDPPIPASGPDPTYHWFETDTGDSFDWDYGGAAWVQVNTATSLADGDYGDFTFAAGVATIDPGAVTLAKQANMATASVVYRKTAGAGAPEVQTLATLKTDLGLTGTNSGDQTSIVGITGTVAQFNTAISDGDLATGGGTATGTNTGDQTSIVGITGTKAEFNTACSDGDFSYSGAFRGALVKRASDQTTANYTTATAIPWTNASADYDTDSIWSSGANTRLSVPSGVTKVRLSAQASIQLSTNSVWHFLYIRKNGSAAYTGVAIGCASIPAGFPILQVHTPVLTVVGGTDYFEAFLLVQTDTSITVQAVDSWFAMEIIE